MRIKQFCLSILLMLAPVLALACSGIPYALFHYQPWGQGTKYVVEEDYDYGINFKDIEIREVKLVNYGTFLTALLMNIMTVEK